MYQQNIINLCNEKTLQQIVKTKEYKELLLDATNFLNILEKVTFTTRLFVIQNNIHKIPKCKVCNNLCNPKKDDAKLGFNEYCSPQCSRSDKTVHKDKLILLENKEWLYNQRINLKKSKDLIATELNISITPVNKWIKFHNIPDVKYNESNSDVVIKLSNYDWLYNEHKTLRKTCEQIANELNSSKSTVLIWLSKHNIQANEANLYDRKHIKVSNECNEIIDYIKSIYDGEIISNNRGFIGSLELDIVLPEKNIAIEYNGVYSHIYRPHESSFSAIKDHNYHLQKTNLCEGKGIQLIHIFSDSWKNKKEIWKSFIKNKLGICENKVYARKCTIKEIDTYTKNMFLDENHLQGKDKSKLKYGLFNNDILVAVMTFSKPRYNVNYKWELTRFSILKNYSVVGAFSKLLNNFRKNNSGSIISYADRTYSNGNVYNNNGFKLININRPSYYYVKKNTEQRLHRSNFTKNKITDKNDARTEQEIMFDNDYYKIFDCGTLVFVII